LLKGEYKVNVYIYILLVSFVRTRQVNMNEGEY